MLLCLLLSPQIFHQNINSFEYSYSTHVGNEICHAYEGSLTFCLI